MMFCFLFGVLTDFPFPAFRAATQNSSRLKTPQQQYGGSRGGLAVHLFFFFFNDFYRSLLPFDSAGALRFDGNGCFGWRVAWMHVEHCCNSSVSESLIWANNLLKKTKSKTITLHLQQNSLNTIFTHTPARTHTHMKKGILQIFFCFFSFLLSLKRTIKYIKTYLQCVGFFFFGQKNDNKTKQTKTKVKTQW